MKQWSPRARRLGTTLLILAAVQAALVVVYRLATDRRRELPAFETERLNGSVAPTPALRTVDGEAVSWSELRGRPVLLHFWATWCSPCRDELPTLLELARSQRSRLHVLAVSLDSDWSSVRLFFDGEIPEQVTRPAESDLQRRYGVTTLPDTFVVSASGKLVERARGARDWSSAGVLERLPAWEARP